MKTKRLALCAVVTWLSCVSQRDACKEKLERESYGDYCLLFLVSNRSTTEAEVSQRFTQGALAMCAAQLAQREACNRKSPTPSTLLF